MNTQSSSQDLVNLRISSVTGSINTTTSSFDNVFLRISSVTGSMNTTTSSFDNVFLGISSVTGAMNTQSSSQDLVNLRISSTTGSINTTTSSFNSEFIKIGLTTSSIHFTTQSLNTQTGSQDLVNLGISTFTSSLRSEVNLIEAYTASLKAVAIVSSSQQIKDYYTFAQTASANTFYGNQTITGSLLVSGSSHTIQNGYIVLTQVSQSLNFADDASAASAGVPLGGLYRNGNFIAIRID